MKKTVFYSEIAYFAGLFLLAFGTGMTVFGNFGLSMVVAPAYILHVWLSQFWSWFTFGVGEYVLQGTILVFIWLALKGRKVTCLMSFLSAVLYGLILDGSLALMAYISNVMWLRITVYVVGVLFCTAGISLLFHSYLPPAAYELLVMVFADRYQKKLTVCKTVYDCLSLVVSVVLSFVLFGKILGVGVGTVVCALLYGWLIGRFSQLWERVFAFRDRWPLRQKL